MAKIKWKKLKKNDRVFQQGFIISSPNRFKDQRKIQDNSKKELLFLEPFNEKEPEDQLIQRLIKSLKKIGFNIK